MQHLFFIHVGARSGVDRTPCLLSVQHHLNKPRWRACLGCCLGAVWRAARDSPSSDVLQVRERLGACKLCAWCQAGPVSTRQWRVQRHGMRPVQVAKASCRRLRRASTGQECAVKCATPGAAPACISTRAGMRRGDQVPKGGSNKASTPPVGKTQEARWMPASRHGPRNLQRQGNWCITLNCLQDGDEYQAQVGVREPGV